MDYDDLYQVQTEDDTRQSVRHALDYCGFTYDELEQQARQRDFATERARRAWFAVRGLRQFADEVTG